LFLWIFDFFHVLAAADQSAAADCGNHHLIAAYIAAIFLTLFFYRHVSNLLSFSRTGSHFLAFSAAGLAGVSTAALPFDNLDKIIPKKKVDLPMEGQWC